MTAMLNMRYAFESTPKVRPWVGLGVGIARHKVNGKSKVTGSVTTALLDGSEDGTGIATTSKGSLSKKIDESDTSLAYHAGVGVSYALTDTVEVRGGYRYFGLDDYKSHDFEAGMEWRW